MKLIKECDTSSYVLLSQNCFGNSHLLWSQSFRNLFCDVCYWNFYCIESVDCLGFSNIVHVCSDPHGVRLFATLWTVAHQAPLSMVFSQRKYWSRLPFPPLGNLPNPGMELASADGFFTTSATWEAF